MHWLDDVYGWMASRPLFFPGGFGNAAELERLGASFGALKTPEIQVDWDDDGALRAGVRLRHGAFDSPCAEDLPDASRRARFQLLLPEESHANTPVMVHLAATGAQGFSQRQRIAFPLVRQGIGALILENPYYGTRRPPGQRGVALHTVADQLRMNRATVVEALGLLAWLENEGYARIGVTGFSLGGVMAAMVGGLFPRPIAVVPVAGSVSLAPMFVDGVLARGVAWDVLAREAGGREAARRRLADVLDRVSAAAVPVPRNLRSCVAWAARGDGFVPPASVEPFAETWPGAEIRWSATGHVAGYLWHLASWHAAIRAGIERL